MADSKKTKQRLIDLRGADDTALATTVRDAEKRIYQFHKDRVSKPQSDVKVVKNARKEIARVLTIKRERELAAEAKN